MKVKREVQVTEQKMETSGQTLTLRLCGLGSPHFDTGTDVTHYMKHQKSSESIRLLITSLISMYSRE